MSYRPLNTGAYSGKQCAADRTQSLEMMDPPQTWPLVPIWMSTCHGHAPSLASLPPTMRVPTRGLPHSADQISQHVISFQTVDRVCRSSERCSTQRWRHSFTLSVERKREYSYLERDVLGWATHLCVKDIDYEKHSNTKGFDWVQMEMLYHTQYCEVNQR